MGESAFNLGNSKTMIMSRDSTGVAFLDEGHVSVDRTDVLPNPRQDHKEVSAERRSAEFSQSFSVAWRATREFLVFA